MAKNKINKHPLIVILVGPPGSGKGTQADLLRKKFKLELIGSGDLLRARKKIKDFTGKKIAQTIDGGKRVPTPIIFNLWMEKMESFAQKPNFRGLIMDGSPRTKMEADMLELVLDWYGWQSNKKVIFLDDIAPKKLIWRLTRRRVCSGCNRNIPYLGAMKDLKACDRCGGKLVTRADDNPQGVKERLGWYKRDVMPAIDFYRRKKELIEIDGDQPIEKVFSDILKAIGK